MYKQKNQKINERFQRNTTERAIKGLKADNLGTTRSNSGTNQMC